MSGPRAALIRRFGGPEVVNVEEVPTPEPGPGEVLVRVAAAGVGPWDATIRSGRSALPQPLPLVLGADLAGTVEALGPEVTTFAYGDPVFGATNPRFTGAHADLALAQASMLAPAPADVSSVEAAAMPIVAVTAWQMLELARVGAGSRIVVLGAVGNVGAWATRLAVVRGAQVEAVVLPAERGMADSLGAQRILVEPPAHGTADVVLDTVGGPLASLALGSLRPEGVLVTSVAPLDARALGRPDVTTHFFLVEVTRERLSLLADLLDSKVLTSPVRIGEVLPLEQARRAHEMLDGIRPRRPGKLLLATGSQGT